MRKQFGMKFFIGAICATLLTLIFQGCGHYTSPYAIGYGTPSLIGPGDWNGYLNSSAGVIEYQHQANQGSAIDYIGIASLTSYTTGFDSLSITSVGPQDNGSAPVGSTSYDVQIPGFAYFWAPFQTAGAVQAMVPPVCPSADISANFVVLKPRTGWSTGLNNGDALGTMTFSTASGGTVLVHDYNLDASTTISSDMGTSSVFVNGSGCNAGRYSDGASETFVGPNNFLIMSSNGGYYFAVQAGSLPSLATLAGNYSGILYKAGAGTNSAVSVTLNSSGTGTSTIVTDVTAGTGSTGPVISLGSALTGGASGFYGGTINFSGSSDPLVCLPQAAAGGTSHNLLACVGEDDGHAFVSLILVSH